MRRRQGNLRHRRGTAMIEFVMCLPFLGFILLLTFFFGWAMRNQQQVKMADRYLTWYRVYHHEPEDAVRADLNKVFFQNKVADPPGPQTDSGWGPTLAQEGLVTGAGDMGRDAEDLANRLVLADLNWYRFSPSYQTELRASFETSVNLWRAITNNQDIRSRHLREGTEWRRGQAPVEGAVRDQFLTELNNALDAVESPGENFAAAIRRLYEARW